MGLDHCLRGCGECGDDLSSAFNHARVHTLLESIAVPTCSRKRSIKALLHLIISARFIIHAFANLPFFPHLLIILSRPNPSCMAMWFVRVQCYVEPKLDMSSDPSMEPSAWNPIYPLTRQYRQRARLMIAQIKPVFNQFWICYWWYLIVLVQIGGFRREFVAAAGLIVIWQGGEGTNEPTVYLSFATTPLLPMCRETYLEQASWPIHGTPQILPGIHHRLIMQPNETKKWFISFLFQKINICYILTQHFQYIGSTFFL